MQQHQMWDSQWGGGGGGIYQTVPYTVSCGSHSLDIHALKLQSFQVDLLQLVQLLHLFPAMQVMLLTLTTILKVDERRNQTEGVQVKPLFAENLLLHQLRELCVSAENCVNV